MIRLADPMHGSVDASDLGLAPGDFPRKLTVEVPGRGEVTLRRAGMIIRRGEAVGYEYEADDGFELVVHND